MTQAQETQGPSSFEVSNIMHDSTGSQVRSGGNIPGSNSMEPLPFGNASLAMPFGGKVELIDSSLETVFEFNKCNVFASSLTEQVAGIVNQHGTQEAKGDQIQLENVAGGDIKSYSPGQLVSDLKNADINKNTGLASHGGQEH